MLLKEITITYSNDTQEVVLCSDYQPGRDGDVEVMKFQTGPNALYMIPMEKLKANKGIKQKLFWYFPPGEEPFSQQ